MSKIEVKKLTLQSTFEELDRIESFVDELQEWANLGEEDYNRIMLTLSEAVNNAILHGNEEDPDKNVHIAATLESDQQIMRISVEDEGSGFDPEELPNPLKDENLLNEGGRGVYLIKQYADNVEFKKEGTKVTITYRLSNK